MIEIFIVPQNQFISTGVYGVMDILDGANLLSKKVSGRKLFNNRVLTSDGKPVTSFNGTTITPEGTAINYTDPDVVIIPPVLLHGNDCISLNPQLKKWIIERHGKGSIVAAVGTGVFLLAETGLLDNRLATTHWIYRNKFRRTFPKVILNPEKMVTEEDNLICTGAMMGFLSMILLLIEKYGSKELMHLCSKSMIIDPESKSHLPFMGFLSEVSHSDNAVKKAQSLMGDNYNKNLNIDFIARESGLSLRHFRRRFKKATGASPNEYLQRLKIEKAKKILEETEEPVSQITLRVGYEETSSFYRMFKKNTGVSPKMYRELYNKRN